MQENKKYLAVSRNALLKKRAKLETENFVMYSLVLFLFLSFSFFTLFL